MTQQRRTRRKLTKRQASLRKNTRCGLRSITQAFLLMAIGWIAGKLNTLELIVSALMPAKECAL